MASEALIKVIEQQDVLEQASDQIQPLVTGAFKSAGPAGQEVKNFLHGTWLGHPLHPVLTDVPIGAWTAALALDAMETISGRRELGAGADAGFGKQQPADANAGPVAAGAEQAGGGGGPEENALAVPDPGTARGKRPTDGNVPARQPSHCPQLAN